MVLGFQARTIFFPPGKLLERSGIKPDQHVLNFGCAAGSHALAAAEIVGVGGRVYALDMHPRAVLRVRRLAQKKGLTNMQTILSDGPTNLPDGIIDTVFMCDVFHELEEPDKILAEMHRVLKPDGVLAFTERYLSDSAIKAQVTGGGLFKLSAQDGKLFKFSKVTEEAKQ